MSARAYWAALFIVALSSSLFLPKSANFATRPEITMYDLLIVYHALVGRSLNNPPDAADAGGRRFFFRNFEMTDFASMRHMRAAAEFN